MYFLKGFIIVHVIVILLISVCEPQPVIINALFKTFPIQGTYLEVYDTRKYVRSVTDCGDVCSKERAESTKCEAFHYHPLDGTCDLYTTGGILVGVSNINVLEFQATDRFYTISIGDKLFSIYRSSVAKTYSDARTHCHDLGGHLLELDSLDKHDAVKMIASNTGSAWVGANDIALQGTWVSDRDGLPIDLATWLWNGGEPNNGAGYGAEDCAELFFDNMRMNDLNCDMYSRPYLCESFV